MPLQPRGGSVFSIQPSLNRDRGRDQQSSITPTARDCVAGGVSWQIGGDLPPTSAWHDSPKHFNLAKLERTSARYSTGNGMAQPGFFRRSALSDFLILACVPIFALALTRMHLGPSGVDPWLYFGYGTNFSYLLSKFGWTYYAARLPWNAITSLFFSILEPKVAVFMLGMAVSFIGSISLYAILRHSCSRPAAFMTAFALQANSWYLGHSFWLYVDSPVISLSLLCIALSLHGIYKDRAWSIGLVGTLMAIGINIHPMMVALVLPAVGLILLFARPIGIRRCLNWAFWFCLGGLIATLVLCTAAWLTFGNFFYFSTTITTAQFMLANDYGRHYQLPFSIWASGATALALPMGALCWAVIIFGREFGNPSLRRDRWISYYGILLIAFWVIIDVFFRLHVNQHTFYFIYIWIPVFLIAGVLIDRFVGELRPSLSIAVVGSIAIPLLTLILADPYWNFYSLHRLVVPLLTYGILGVLLLVSCIVLLSRRPGGAIRVLGILTSIAFFSVASATDRRAVATSNFELYPVIWFLDHANPDIATIVDTQHVVANNTDASNGIIFWYNKQEANAQAFLSICASFRYWFLNESMPTLPNTDLLGAPMNLVMLAPDSAKLDEALGTLRDRGFLKEVTAKSAVGSGKDRVLVWVVATRSTADAARFAAESPTRP